MCHFRKTVLMPLAILAAGCQSMGSGAASSNVTAASAAGGSDARAAVTELHEQHRKALLAKDVSTLDRIWTDDFTFINYRGQLLTKAQRLDNVRNGATSFKSIQLTDQVVRTYGDAALLTGVVILDGQYSGEEGGGTYRFTSVCPRQGGQWKIAHLQMTRIEK